MIIKPFIIIVLLVTLSPGQIFRNYTLNSGAVFDSTNITKKRKITKVYRKDGSVEMEIETHNGRRDGVTKEFYPNGVLKVLMHFKNGREDGESLFFFDTGILKKRIVYKRGKIELVETYDSKGNIISRVSEDDKDD